MRRTMLGLVAVAIIATVVAAVAVWPGGGGSSSHDELARRLASVEDPERFSFEHRAGGSRVLDCFLPSRQISGAVDYDAALAVFRDDTGAEIARKQPDQVLLHRELFAEDAVPTTWLEVELPMDDELRARLATIFGTELAGYLLTPGLPPSGQATALAALDAADRIESLPPTTIDGRRNDGCRITVDDDHFADVAGRDDGLRAPTTDLAPPTINVWIDDDDEVARVTVVPGPLEPEDEPAGGWSIDYRTPGPRLRDPRPSSVTHDGDIELSRLQGRPPSGECQVPL